MFLSRPHEGQRASWRLKLDHNHLDQIVAKLERVRFEIDIAKEFVRK